MAPRWPSLFIVGAAKCGTTTVARYLAQHPEIGFSTVKEPNFFALEGRDLRAMRGPAEPAILWRELYQWSVTDEQEYLRLFSAFGDRPIWAEASVRYLACPEAAGRIHRVAPDAKIVIMLRHPAKRAWSHYAMMRCVYQLEPLSFEEALRAEDQRRAAAWDYDWHYLAVSRYAGQVARYLEYFDRPQIGIFFLEDFVKRPQVMLEQLQRFAGVSEVRPLPLPPAEKTGVWHRSHWVARLLDRPGGVGPLGGMLARCGASGLAARLRSLNATRLPPIPPGANRLMRDLPDQQKADLKTIAGVEVPW
jgi:hypothetical protein